MKYSVRITLFALFSFSVVGPSSVRGTEGEVGLSSSPLSLEHVLVVVQRDNPEIKAARERWRAFAARVSQAATPTKPRVDFERMDAPRGDHVWTDAGERNLVISQELPFPTTLYFMGQRARQEAKAAESAFHSKEHDVLSRAKQAYARLFLSHHAIEIFKEYVNLMGQFSKVAEAKYAAGKASQIDALKAQVELSKMLNELVTLQQEKEINEALLNTLLNRPPGSLLGRPIDPDPRPLAVSLSELEAEAVIARPDLREAAFIVDKSRTQVTLSRSDYLPDLMLQYRQRNRVNGTDSHDAMVGVTVPLWFWKQGALVREARAERDMAQAEYQTLKNQTLFDVKSFLVKAQTAQRLVDLYQTSVLPQAEHALKITEASYRADRMGFLELLDAVRSLLQFRLEHYEHLAQFEQFKAELERVVGVRVVTKEAR
ncbi:MAG: TolC family protein [Elusimicrobia bacterium]|nr:TolC family protein [Elusimicrobiota bacterium]